MFIRVKSRPNTKKKSVQIVQNKRKGDKVVQKVVQTIGYAFDEDTLNHLKDIGEHLKATLETQKQLNILGSKKLAEMAIRARKRKEDKKVVQQLNVNLKKLKEEQRNTIGIHEAYGKVYQELGFDQVLTKRYKSASNILYHIVMARLASPKSKRASVSLLEKDFGIALNLNKVYRMMDKIDDSIVEKIQKTAYRATKSILKEKINVLFYDCTTLYFESFSPDELKKNGYSKDGKFNQPQVLLALLVTEAGLPIGYEVFPGNTFEGHTLVPIIEKIKSKYDLEKVVFVADSGLLSKENRAFLEQNNFEYILGARLRNLPKTLQKTVLSTFKSEQKTTENTAEIDYQGKRIILKYSPKRARKDKKDREEAIERIKKNFKRSKNPKSLLSNYGYKKFLNVTGTSTLEINQIKIEEETKWDGISGIITNVKDLSHEEVINNYKNLWQIENCFRIQKTDLKIRPIYHWTPNRVRAHIAICFIAFSCQQYLSYRLRMQKNTLSIEQVRNALTHIQVSILKHIETKRYYGIPSKANEEARSIYKILCIKYDTVPFLIQKDKPSERT